MDELAINPWLALGLICACLLLSAFFSSAETAMSAASKARMLALEGAGDRRAGIVSRLLDTRERLIGAMLVGNNVVNVGVSAFATTLFVSVVGAEGVIYATAIMSVLIIVFAEVLPKTVAITRPEQTALVFARPIALVVALFGPVLIAVEAIVRGVLRLFGMRIKENQNVLTGAEELRGTVDLMHKEGSFEKLDRDMLGGILDLRDLTVEDVMVHRTKMVTIDASDAPEKIVRDVLAAPYTRIPLWRDTPENIIGVLHGKDLLRALAAGRRRPLQDRPVQPRAARLVRAGFHQPAGPAQGLPAPQDAFRLRGRRIRGGDGPRDPRGHHRGDRRRHQGRARRAGHRRAAPGRWFRQCRRLRADPRPQSRHGLAPA